MANPEPGVGDMALSSSGGRGVIATTVAGTSVLIVAGAVLYLALPTIARDLGASTSQQQWIINSFLLTVSSLILLGGTFGDRYGRVRVYRFGIAWVSVASVALSLAPNIEILLAIRVFEALGSALLIPGSLAILEATLREEDRGRGIGLWAGLTGLAAAVGPLVGGALLGVSWRLVFLVNIPVAILAFWLARKIPESSNPSARSSQVDWFGAVLLVVMLGTGSFALIEGPNSGFVGLPAISVGIALISLVWLIRHEQTHPDAIIPIDLFENRVFVGANVITLLLYVAIGIFFFLLPIQLQVALGFSPFKTSLTQIPTTVFLLLFASYAGAFTQRHGPRIPLTLGSIVLAAALISLSFISPETASLLFVLLAVTFFAIGLAMVVAPVTSTALASVSPERSGAASGFNNTVARIAQLLSVAAIPPLSGLTGDALNIAEQVNDGFRIAMLIASGVAVASAIFAAVVLHSGPIAERDLESGDHRACVLGRATHPNRALKPDL